MPSLLNGARPGARPGPQTGPGAEKEAPGAKKSPLKFLLVAGARPNFVKIAPLIRAIEKRNRARSPERILPLLVHTGQHYDRAMSGAFFDDLGIPPPDFDLGIGSGSHGLQTGRALIALEKVFLAEKPDAVIVVGDVNSTLAAALAAVKLGIPIAHVEAGLRSFDRSMPEEINRVLTDAVSGFLFVSAPEGVENLKKEGVPDRRIFLVGDLVADAVLGNRERARHSSILERLGLKPSGYALFTLHRPGNVDRKDKLENILAAAGELSAELPLVFPVHPRTAGNIAAFGLGKMLAPPGLITTEPLGYLDFIRLEMEALFLLTDSGGIQEEAATLGIPCLTLRDTTERHYTLSGGANTLVGADRGRILRAARAILSGKRPAAGGQSSDGGTADRIIETLARETAGKQS